MKKYMHLGCFKKLGITMTQALTCQLAGAIALSANCAIAQITPDSTLPNNSNVRLDGNTTIIEGGTTRGANLFHSFSEFSVLENTTAFFNNASDVQNIFSRVTGGNSSEINGLIKANPFGNANLFLINPNGIVFGSKGSLDIRGSFIATTANALQFGSLGNFSATNPEVPSALLTINPSAFLYNQINIETIQNSSVAPAGLHLANFETYGLRVPDGKSILLVGGNVTMDNGQLNAYGGRIELTGLAAPGSINLIADGDTFSTQVPKLSRSDVFLNNGAIANVSYKNGGSIAVNARNIDLSKNSSLNAGIEATLGSATAKAGNITLSATEAITIEEQSEIRNQVRENGIGNAGDVDITTNLLSVKGGSGIYTRSYSQGNAGNININANGEVSFLNGSFGSTTLESTERSTGVGKSGDLQILADSVLVDNGSQLKVSSLSQGNAGNINITANGQVSFLDGSFGSTTLESTGVGKSGDLQILADSVVVGNDSQLKVSTLGQGDAGNLTIYAPNTVEFYSNSFAFSQVEKGEGNGGIIKIKTGSLTLNNNSFLSASSLAIGDAGSVQIQASDNVSFANKSKAFTTVQDGGRGDANNISIQARSVSVTNESFLTAGTFGEGNAGK